MPSLKNHGDMHRVDSVSVLQKECIPTAKRIKHETEAESPASLGIAASPSAISSVFTVRRKL